MATSVGSGMRQSRQRFDANGWILVVAAALTLALASWMSNITTVAQLSGEADRLLAFRFTISMLANSGTVWAGLAILSGWFVRRPAQAAVAGIVGSELSLAAHYAAGRLSGMFDATIWDENSFWFLMGLVLGGPLGLIGAAARRSDAWGLFARLVVPVGALIEPIFVGLFSVPPMLPWPQRFASAVCGTTLMAGGVLGAVMILRLYKRNAGSPEAHLPPESRRLSSNKASDADTVERW